MKRLIHGLVCIAMVVSLGAVFTAPSSPARAQSGTFTPVFESAPCKVAVPSGLVEGKDLKCGYVTVPEQHENPTGPTIKLAVAIMPSTSDSPAPDPLFVEQGGPGGSTLDYFTQAMNGQMGEQIREKRDIVMVEQRGTYYSDPALTCPELLTQRAKDIEQNMTIDQEHQAESSALAECRTRLVKEGVDLSAFDSVENAADIDSVRQALGYDQINFYGVSYGTMLGQHYMRDFPQSLRSVILDGVVPLSLNFIPEIPSTGQRVLDLIFQTCAADSACHDAYPDLENEFYQTIQNLNQNPATVPMTDPKTGNTYQAVLTGDRYAYIIFYLFYVTQILPELPTIIHDAYNGTFTTLGFIAPYLLFDYTMADAMYYSVICAEDSDMQANDTSYLQGVNPLLLPALDYVKTMISDCSMWNVIQLDPSVDNAVVSDIPTLLLSGQFDPITPPSFAAVVAKDLSHSFSYTIPAQGHGSFDSTCGFDISIQFLNDPTMQPDSSCIDQTKLTFSGAETAVNTDTNVYTDPAGNFQVTGPDGWSNQSSSMAATFTDMASGSVIAVVAMPGIDPQAAIEATLSGITPGFKGDPIDTFSLELANATWDGKVYDLGNGLTAITLTTERNTVTYLLFGAAMSSSTDTLRAGMKDMAANLEFLK